MGEAQVGCRSGRLGQRDAKKKKKKSVEEPIAEPSPARSISDSNSLPKTLSTRGVCAVTELGSFEEAFLTSDRQQKT